MAIRSAVEDDAFSIARIQILAWRQAYAGLMPQDFLDRMDSVRRVTSWRRALSAPAAMATDVMLGPDGDMISGDYESYGLPGPGRWVTIYASPDHVFMYVAGLRWDTHDAAGPGDGSTGIGWHPLVREADGFIARHPVGL